MSNRCLRLLCAGALACFAAGLWTTRAVADSANGVWWNSTKTVQVEIFEDANGLEGRIVWLKEPFDAGGNPKRDIRNADPSKRTQPVLGLQVLSGLHPHRKRPNVWHGGTAYDASVGKAYRCTVRMVEEDRVLVRGYVGIPLLGRNEWWTRVSETDLAATSKPPVQGTTGVTAVAEAPGPVLPALPQRTGEAAGSGG